MRSHCQINHLFCLAAALYSAPALALQGGMLTATVKAPPPAETGYFKLGATRSPDGHELTVNSRCVLLDGRSWFPVIDAARIGGAADGGIQVGGRTIDLSGIESR